MTVGVLQARHDGVAAEIDDSGRGALHRESLGARADGNEAAVADRKGVDARPPYVGCVDRAAHDDEIGRRLAQRADGRHRGQRHQAC